MKWENRKFVEFIQLQRGHDLTKEQFDYGPYPVVSSTSIIGYHSEYKANGPGVVIGRSGTLGTVQYINEDYWPHNTALYVKDFKGSHPRFVYYFLTNFATEKHGGGSAVPTLNRNALSSINIRVPGIDTQGCIADILFAYDNLIENGMHQIKLLEETAIRLYGEWFVNLRFPGYETTRIVDGVPDGWIRSKTKVFVKFVYGKALKAETRKEGHYPVYGSSGIIGYHNEFFVKAPVVIVGRKGNVGSVYISFDDAYPIDTVFYIQSKISIYYTYFNLLLRKYNNNDSAVPGLNRDYAESMEMICPSKNLLDKFDNMISLLFEKQILIKKQIDLLLLARNMLLPKLMNGEIEV